MKYSYHQTKYIGKQVALRTYQHHSRGHHQHHSRGHPRIDHEAPEVEQRYICTLSLTSALNGGEWSTPRPGRFTPGTHCIGCWVGHRAGLDGCGKSHPHRDSIAGLSIPYQVAIPIEISWPTFKEDNRRKVSRFPCVIICLPNDIIDPTKLN